MSFTPRARISCSASSSNSKQIQSLYFHSESSDIPVRRSAFARLVWLWNGVKNERLQSAISAAHGHPSSIFRFKNTPPITHARTQSGSISRLSLKSKFSQKIKLHNHGGSDQFLQAGAAQQKLPTGIRKEEPTFMKLSTVMLLNLSELSCKFWESLSKQPTEPEPQFAAVGLQETKFSSALTNYVWRIRGPCQGGTWKPRPFDSMKQPTSCSAGSPEKNASQTWINKLLQSENQTHFSPSVPPLSAKSGKVKWRQPFMVLRGGNAIFRA